MGQIEQRGFSVEGGQNVCLLLPLGGFVLLYEFLDH
jgi:hypothetical protein